MLRPDSRTSNNSFRVRLFIHDFPRSLDSFAKVRVPDRLFRHQIHRPAKKALQRIGEVQILSGVASGGRAVNKADKEIEIAAVRRKPPIGRRAEYSQARDSILPAKGGHLILMIMEQCDHADWSLPEFSPGNNSPASQLVRILFSVMVRSMPLPVITGLIRRRLLVNFRADPEVTQRLLPPGLRPKLHDSHAIVGICLIRLEQIRPKGLPALLGIASENAAHRIAVEWTGGDGGREEGVFIPRRDTDSALNALAGGRVFPGVHHRSRFTVKDDGKTISLSMIPDDRVAGIEVNGGEAAALPATSCFASLEESSAFFERGCIGYSVSRDANRLDGLKLSMPGWEVRPLEVRGVHSGFFTDESRFPRGSVEFDHGLIMRDLRHDWLAMPGFECAPRG